MLSVITYRIPDSLVSREEVTILTSSTAALHG